MCRTGLVLEGRAIVLPGFDIQNFIDNPKLKLAIGDMRWRNARERNSIRLIVMHTTGGIPGGKDLRPQVILPGFGPSTNAGERVVGSWTHDTNRPGGAHLIIDFDGRIYCCADLLTEAAYHAERANGPSVGIEVVQGHDACLYQEQINLAARFVLALCRVMPTPIQFQITKPYNGQPLNRFVLSQQLTIPLNDVVGIVGHRDLTSNRGEGDPGGAIMDALALAGCERFDFDRCEDIIIWKNRQAILGMAIHDGIAGPATVSALKQAGHPDGIWRSNSNPPSSSQPVPLVAKCSTPPAGGGTPNA
jgi:hypothetical protein